MGVASEERVSPGRPANAANRSWEHLHHKLVPIFAAALIAIATVPGTAAADGEDLPDIAVVSARDRLGGYVVEDARVRERHFVTATIANLGTAPSGRLIVYADPDPVDPALPRAVPLEAGNSQQIASLAPGASVNVTVEWSMLPTALDMDVTVHAFPIPSGNESSETNNHLTVRAEASTPVTIPPIGGPLLTGEGNVASAALHVTYTVVCGPSSTTQVLPTACDQLTGRYGYGQMRFGCKSPQRPASAALWDLFARAHHETDAVLDGVALPPGLADARLCAGAYDVLNATAAGYGATPGL